METFIVDLAVAILIAGLAVAFIGFTALTVQEAADRIREKDKEN